MTDSIQKLVKLGGFTIIAVLLLWFLYLTRYVLLGFFVSFIIMSAVSPIVKKLQEWSIPKPVGVPLVYLLLFAVIIGLFAIGLIPFINQFNNLIDQTNNTIEQLQLTRYVDASAIEQRLGGIAGNIFQFSTSVFSNLFTVFTVFFVSVYMTFEKELIYKQLSQMGNGVSESVQKIEKDLGGWVRAQIIISVLIGGIYYATLLFFGIEYALPIAVVGGILEIIPILGPLLSSIPAILLGIAQSWWTGLWIALSFLVIQQLESHIIYPLIMHKSVHLNPLIILFAVAVGEALLGLFGVFIAVPAVIVLRVIVRENNLFKLINVVDNY